MYKDSLSLILTLLIIGSLLTGTVLVGDIIIRHSKTIKGTEVSEIAFFAGESAIEKAAYHVLKNHVNIDTCVINGTFSSTASYEVSSISATASSSPWEKTLQPNESLQLDLNINEDPAPTPIYPTSLVITIDSAGGEEPSDLIVHECTTTLGGVDACTTGGEERTTDTCTQNFSVEFGNSITIDAPTNYYKIRINNNGDAAETYSLAPAGGSGTLPIGIDISSTGEYSGYERKLKINLPKWQIFGS